METELFYTDICMSMQEKDRKKLTAAPPEAEQSVVYGP